MTIYVYQCVSRTCRQHRWEVRSAMPPPIAQYGRRTARHCVGCGKPMALTRAIDGPDPAPQIARELGR